MKTINSCENQSKSCQLRMTLSKEFPSRYTHTGRIWLIYPAILTHCSQKDGTNITTQMMIKPYGKKAEQTRLPLTQWLPHFISLFIWIFFNTVCWIFDLAFRTWESAELLKKFCFSRNETPFCKSHLSKHLWKHSECELQISLGDRQ